MKQQGHQPQVVQGVRTQAGSSGTESRVAKRSILRRVLGESVDAGKRSARPIAFEPLERRELMATDFFDAASSASQSRLLESLPTNPAAVSTTAQRTGSVAEGEAVASNDLVGFAKALTAAGAKLYGADWNAETTNQRNLFAEIGRAHV